MTARSDDQVRDLVETADMPAPLLERQASPHRQLAAASALDSRDLVRRTATAVVSYLSHRAQYVGRVGIIGVALLVFSIVCFLSANSSLRHQLAGLRSDFAEVQHQVASHRTAADVAPSVQLQTFVSKLPARTELPAITAQVVEQANAAGLVLERGSYDFTITPSGKIVRARLDFPVQGTYPKLRQFVDRTLVALPAVAVDGLRLERKAIGAAEISAEIRFAVFLRNDQ